MNFVPEELERCLFLLFCSFKNLIDQKIFQNARKNHQNARKNHQTPTNPKK